MGSECFFSHPGDKQPIAALLDRWKERWPDCGAFALCSESALGHVAALQDASRETGVPVVGALFPEIIVNSKFEKSGVLLVRMDSMPDYLLMENVAANPGREEQLLSQLSELTASLDKENRALVMIFDALVPNIGSILGNLYLRLGNHTTYAGANAGSETFQPMDCLFDPTRLIQGGVLALAFNDHAAKGMLAHGYQPAEASYMATSTTGNRVETVNWQPAFSSYQAVAKAEYGLQIDRESFYEKAVHFPFGIVKGNGQVLVRIPVALSENGEIFCVGEIPENSILTLLDAPRERLLQSAKELAGTISSRPGSRGLFFYCAGRRLHLGAGDSAKELTEMSHKLGPVSGALSLGEIGCQRSSIPEFHNGAILYIPWPGKGEKAS